MLEVIVEPPLVKEGKLDVKLVCEVDEEPAGEETDELGWLTLALDKVELTSVEAADEETTNDELGSTELLVDILVAGGLLGGKVLLELGRGTELDRVVSVDHVLDAWLDIVGERLELELCPGGTTVVSVDVQALDVWLDVVVDRLKLGLCPGGMTIVVVVGEGTTVKVEEDGALLLRPLVLETDEFP